MAKKKTKLSRGEKVIVWRRERERVPRIDMSEEIGATCTLINLFLNGKYKKEADLLWAEEIKKVGRCEMTGDSNCQLNAHHIISRTRLKFRYDLSNGVCLSAYSHSFDPVCCPHGGLDAVKRFEGWLKESRPGQYQWFMENKDDMGMSGKSYEQCYWELKL